jgi:hypothetical protein
VIWRGLLPRHRRTKYRELALSGFGAPSNSMPGRKLKVLHEQRPYEFGWLLFAFGTKSKLQD